MECTKNITEKSYKEFMDLASAGLHIRVAVDYVYDMGEYRAKQDIIEGIEMIKKAGNNITVNANIQDAPALYIASAFSKIGSVMYNVAKTIPDNDWADWKLKASLVGELASAAHTILEHVIKKEVVADE
ncbi:MAG: hypothetical protein J6X53_04945 [Abditibacteriota bacterium]|nr:hypothetical protein [Abditibacteriota bacterium]